LALIAEIEQEIANTMQTNIDNEVAAGVGLAEYKVHVFGEFDELARKLDKVKEKLEKYST
jgi:hypothetical protein